MHLQSGKTANEGRVCCLHLELVSIFSLPRRPMAHLCRRLYLYFTSSFFCILSLSDFLSQTTSFYFSPNEFPSTKFPLCPLAVTCPCFVFLKYTHFSTLLLTHTRTHTVRTFRSVAFFFRLMVCSVVPGQALVFSRGQLSSKRKVCLVTCY